MERDLGGPPMTRYPDWPSLLTAEIDRARKRPFCWGGLSGGQDCCLFAADVVFALTGRDFAESFRGRYSSRAEAVALLGARGGLEAVVTGCLGEPLPTALLARRGDVVMVDTPEGRALGVVVGAKAVGAGPQGLTFVPMAGWLKAWRVA